MDPNYNHIKSYQGHQDKGTNNQKLIYKAQLNVLCDEQAQIALQTPPINLQPNSTPPRSFPHLSIDNQTIIQQNQEYLDKQHDFQITASI